MYGMHPKQQLTESMAKKAKENAGKFHNKWLIRTPPGYSCLFVHPLNRVDDRFEILSGVVETDTYINTVNFPFILKKRDNQFLFKRGEPMVQVIPFKRESWKMSIKEDNLTRAQAELSVMGRFIHSYKKLFWSKKSWK
jgi:MinD superfamily P-loop ATPase